MVAETPLDFRQLLDEPTRLELREELARCEREELHLSAVRRQLHNQIDRGFASEHTRKRERQVSDERQVLHRRIEVLRAQVDASVMGRQVAPVMRQLVGM
jgi:hypothetical protein